MDTSQERADMNALAEKWHNSGQDPEYLYKGKTEDIAKELRSWIEARGLQNEATLRLLWDFFKTNDAIFGLRKQFGSDQDMRLAPFKAKYVKNVERVKEYKEIRERSNRRALFLLSTLSHRGFKWDKMFHRSQWSEIDAEVCACLKTLDPRFQAESQLDMLEMKNFVADWHLEHARREAEELRGVLEGVTGEQNRSIHTRPTAAVRFGGYGGIQKDMGNDDIADPVDVTGLIPEPHLYDWNSPTGSLTPTSLAPIEEEPSDIEESAEAIAQRVNDMSVAEEAPRPEKKSKTKSRNSQRKKAKARANEAAKAEKIAEQDENGSQKVQVDG